MPFDTSRLSTMSHLLIIDDELAMRTALADTLIAHGHTVQTAADGEAGMKQALAGGHDLILLDVMMPKLDGLALCDALRRAGQQTPVLMLTARGRIDDRVAGLDAGADDYLVKPFSTRELLARVRALLRRVEKRGAAPDVLQLDDLSIDLKHQTATRSGKAIALSPKEFHMLRLLSQNAGKPVTREQFLDTVWGYNAYPTTRTVDNFISALRAKIEPDPKHPRFLLTVHGVGYRFDLTALPETL
jgi:DNA-binding response OmpR family regulator